MRIKDICHYSHHLNRNMNIRVYGHFGETFLIFPCQNGGRFDFESHGMIDSLSNFINEGKIKLICVESIDQETYSSTTESYEHRAYMLEQYHKYVVDELLPVVYEENKGFTLPIVSGCSMGATHAAILFFRRPDLFKGVLGLSGCYEISYFWNNWRNIDVYNNSPALFLQNIDPNHPYIDLYNQRKIIFCVGNGPWEHIVKWSHDMLKDAIEKKGIKAWMDTWGDDVSHDWPWWKKQYHHFIPYLID